MADGARTVEQDIATLTGWLDDPQELQALLDDHDFLHDEADAREFVERLLLGLDDIKHGRTVPHEEVVRRAAERRLRYRSAAAE